MHPSSTLLAATFALSPLVSAYTLTDSFHPGNFFSSFDFFTGQDPTSGFVVYQNQQQATASKLIGTAPQANNSIYMGVDTSNNDPQGRASVRISSKKSWSKGLFIADIQHMPEGCGTWPAFWLLGSGTWPMNGEIDILEGVNEANNNSITLHTNAGCAIQGSSGFSGKVMTPNCDVNDPAQSKNAGCQVQNPSTQSYGAGFNAVNGGVVATEVTSQGIKVWFWPRSTIPSDIESGNPNPAGWQQPVAAFPAAGCNIDQHFKDMSIIFDTTFCGQWAGEVWSQSSCAAKAPTCQQYVQSNGAAFSEAYWLVNSVNVYQQTPSRIMRRNY
ncbi:MAG: hypothetical protein Q9191_007019 [Dirinaria sp. TL-2023a]